MFIYLQFGFESNQRFYRCEIKQDKAGEVCSRLFDDNDVFLGEGLILEGRYSLCQKVKVSEAERSEFEERLQEGWRGVRKLFGFSC